MNEAGGATEDKGDTERPMNQRDTEVVDLTQEEDGGRTSDSTQIVIDLTNEEEDGRVYVYIDLTGDSC